jgi:hypothetical protein
MVCRAISLSILTNHMHGLSIHIYVIPITGMVCRATNLLIVNHYQLQALSIELYPCQSVPITCMVWQSIFLSLLINHWNGLSSYKLVNPNQSQEWFVELWTCQFLPITGMVCRAINLSILTNHRNGLSSYKSVYPNRPLTLSVAL